MSGLYKLREEVHAKILALRSIEAILLRPSFERLWLESDDLLKEEASKLANDCNKEKLLRWMREHPSIDVDEKPLRELIPIAQKLQIKNYSRMLRDDLVIAIKKAERSKGVAQQTTHARPHETSDRANGSSTKLLQGEGGPSKDSGECSRSAG